MSDQFVIAGNVQQYRQWLGARNPRDFHYVSAPIDLRGYHGGTLHRVGTWYERNDSNEILDIAHAYGLEIKDELAGSGVSGGAVR